MESYYISILVCFTGPRRGDHMRGLWKSIRPDRHRFRRPFCFLGAMALVLAGCSGDSTKPPALLLDPGLVELARGDSTGVIHVRNAGGGTLTWNLTTDATWLTLDPTSGSTISADPVTFHLIEDSLLNGAPQALLSASSDGGGATATIKMWTDLRADADTLAFGEETDSLDLVLANDGTRVLSWNATVEGDWIGLARRAGDLAPGEDTLLVTVTRAGMNPGEYAGAVTAGAGAFGQETVWVAMVVPNHATVSGFVYYAQTLIPISGVRVSAGGISAATGADGAFLLTHVPLGSQLITAEKEGFDDAEVAIELGTAGIVQDLTLRTDTEVYDLVGMITNVLGEPIDRTIVTLLNPDGSATEIATEASEGFYTLANVPPGTHSIRYTRGLYQNLTSATEVTGTGSEHNVQMIADPLIPPDPRDAGPYVARISCAAIEVRWSPNLLENLPTTAGYRVERATEVGGPFTDVSGLIAGRSETRFLDDFPGLDIYHYRMRTENIDGLLGDPGSARTVTIHPWIKFGNWEAAAGERHSHRAVYAANPDRVIVIGGVGCVGGT